MGQSVISVLNRSACCQELLDNTLFTDSLVRGASFLCFEVVPSAFSSLLEGRLEGNACNQSLTLDLASNINFHLFK